MSGASSRVDTTGRMVRFVEDRRHGRSLVIVDAPHSQYARLASRGRTRYVLLPEATRESVGEGEQCECDGMPRVVEPRLTGFWLPERGDYEVREVKVPITVGYVDWHSALRIRSPAGTAHRRSAFLRDPRARG